MDDGSTTQIKRRTSISYRLPRALEGEFDRCVEKSGLSISAFLTKAWHGRTISSQVKRPPIEKQLLRKILAELALIRDELRRIESLDSHTRALLEINHQRLLELRALALNAMGRRP